MLEGEGWDDSLVSDWTTQWVVMFSTETGDTDGGTHLRDGYSERKRD